MICFKIGSLLSKPQGASETFIFDENFTFDEADQCKLTSSITAVVHCLKLPHEINVHITDLQTAAEVICSRCTRPFSLTIRIPSLEREFLINLPEEQKESGEEVFYVDRRRGQIVLDEMLRQEILLHLPAVPICSESCIWQNIQFPKKKFPRQEPLKDMLHLLLRNVKK